MHTVSQNDHPSTFGHDPTETGVVRSFADLCGLHQGTPGWWREPWCIGAASLALPLWLGLWWTGNHGPTVWTSTNLWLYVSLSCWQPMLEELGFRGLLQGVLLDHTTYRFGVGPVTLANLLSSAAFGIAHLPSHPLPWAAGIFIVSLLLGFARERTGSLYPAMALHCYFNAGYFLVSGLPG